MTLRQPVFVMLRFSYLRPVFRQRASHRAAFLWINSLLKFRPTVVLLAAQSTQWRPKMSYPASISTTCIPHRLSFQDKKERVLILLGLFSDSGELYYHLLSGNSVPYLIRTSQFDSKAINRAWRINQHERTGVTFDFGQARLHIDKLYVNFGIIRPHQSVATEFYLSNIGRHEILIVGKPQTSCGCMVADFGESMILHAGDSLPLKVNVSTGKQSIRHAVRVKLQDRETGTMLPVKLELLGSQLASMAIAPAELDFGYLSVGTSVARTLRLSEVTTDRFSIKSVDVGTLPLKYDLTRKRNPDGLNDYHIRLSLSIGEFAAGSHSGVITIHTDSRLRPTVNVPIRFNIRSELEVHPKLIAFGATSVNSTVHKVAMLKSPRISERCKVQFGRMPQGLGAKVRSINEGVCEIEVQLAISTTGPIHESFDVELLAGHWSESITFECCAFGEMPCNSDGMLITMPLEKGSF